MSGSGIEGWWSAGERVALAAGDCEREIFVRRLGAGSNVTCLHGFPSSSYDFAAVAGMLADERQVLLSDFLGFGASAKPTEHVYSLHEQADLIEALWRLEGIDSTLLLAHDLGDSVAQELLARRGEGALGVALEGVVLLNGGLYPGLHRPQPGQTALRDPEQGPALSAMINEELFVASLAPTFAEGFDAASPSAEMWRAMHREEGERIMHRLIAYMADRETHGERWTAALEDTDVPLRFVWGMLDPISGAHMAERIRERLPEAPISELDGVSHWPPLEAPRAVADAVLAG